MSEGHLFFPWVGMGWDGMGTDGEIWPSRNKRLSTPLQPSHLHCHAVLCVRQSGGRPISLFLRATSAEPHDSLILSVSLSPTFSRPNATFIHSRNGDRRLAALAAVLPPGCVLAEVYIP